MPSWAEFQEYQYTYITSFGLWHPLYIMKNKLLRTTRRYLILPKSFSFRCRKQQFMYLERKQKHKDLIYDGTRTRTLRMWSTTVQLSWVSITQKWTLRVFFIIIRHVPNSLTCLCKTPPSIYILHIVTRIIYRRASKQI